MTLKIDKKKIDVKKLLNCRNVDILDIEKTLNIFYVKFLTRDVQKKFCSIIVKFEDRKTINLALRKELI